MSNATQSMTLSEAQETQSLLREDWDAQMTRPVSKQRAGDIGAIRIAANAIAEDFPEAPSLLPASTNGSGSSRLQDRLAALRAARAAATQEDTNGAQEEEEDNA